MAESAQTGRNRRPDVLTGSALGASVIPARRLARRRFPCYGMAL